MKGSITRVSIIIIALLNEAIWINQMFGLYINDTIFMLICDILFLAYILTLVKSKDLIVIKNKSISLESVILIIYLVLMAIPVLMLPLGYTNNYYLDSLSTGILQVNYFARMLSILNPGILLIFVNAYYLIVKRNKSELIK